LLALFRTPHNYEELRARASAEIRQKILELDERSVNLQRLKDAFEASDTWDWETFTQIANETDTSDYEDHLLPSLVEIAEYWPAVTMPPGNGYW
jgi:hypothetical protein